MMIALIALAPATMSAQTEHEFKAMAVEQDFTENGFNWFRHALLLGQATSSRATP